MTKLLFLAMIAGLLPGAPLAGEEPGLRDEDVYYAPIDDGATGDTATAQKAPAGSFLSQARLFAFDIGTGKPVEGAELFLAGAYLGRSPLALKDHLVDRPLLPVSARFKDYSEGLRPGVAVPAQGAVAVALASDRSAGWYTTPAWVLGLGLLAASAAVYDASNSGPGLAMAAGGLAVISLSQMSARFVHLPALRRKAEAYNQASEPAPPHEDRP